MHGFGYDPIHDDFVVFRIWRDRIERAGIGS